MAAGLALTIWPLILSHGPAWPLMNSVVAALLGAMAVLAAIGLRYPLRMLPVLLLELGWKTIWLTAVALPLWRAGRLDPVTLRTVWECLPGLLLVLIIPWRHVAAEYVRRPGDRWRRQDAAA
jgi:hypothetical protein